MTESPSALDTIAVPFPDVPEKEVLDLLIREYGLQGNLTQLVSERDQNFRVGATDGQQFVVSYVPGRPVEGTVPALDR